MTPCPRHPTYTGGPKPDWNCRACRRIRLEANAASLHPHVPDCSSETWIHHGQLSEVHKTVNEEVKTLADLIRVCKIDTNEWEIERWLANKWDMGSKTKSGDTRTTPLYQIKAWLKRKRFLMDARREIEQLKSLGKVAMSGLRAKPSTPECLRVSRESLNYMLEINIPDLHLGKLAWSPETGHADYDSKIAEETFEDALSTLIERTMSYKFSEILLPLGNDILHSDTKFGTTTAGTQLDTDSRYHKNFSRVRDLSIRTIERLRGIAPIKVVLVPGNHDALSVWHLGDSLECYYHECPGVSIDNSPCLRKYHQFGQVMLMFTHGENGKLKDYPLLMATEAPSIFGSTKHREAHCGHTHQLRTQEMHGVRVRTISALCPPDAWHAERGFVGNLRSAEAFVWHKEEGLVGTAVYTI